MNGQDEMMRLADAAAMLEVPFSGTDASVLRVSTDSQPAYVTVAVIPLLNPEPFTQRSLADCENLRISIDQSRRVLRVASDQRSESIKNRR